MPKKPFIPQQWEECSNEKCQSVLPVLLECNQTATPENRNAQTDCTEDVERIVSQIERQGIDIAPSYEEGGYTLHTCIVCGESFKDTFTNKLDGRVEAVELGEKLVIKFGEIGQLTAEVSMGGNVTYTVA